MRLSLQVPFWISSRLSVRSHLPSFVMPIRTISYFSGFIAPITFTADMQDTSCSEDCPPNSTATVRFLSIKKIPLFSYILTV